MVFNRHQALHAPFDNPVSIEGTCPYGPAGFWGLPDMTGGIEYRIYTLDRDGTVSSAKTLTFRGDDEAVEQTKQLVDGHTLELWCGVKLIGRFPPKD